MNFEELRKKETERILEKLDELAESEKATYLNAYADALQYAHNFLEISERKSGLSKLEKYLP